MVYCIFAGWMDWIGWYPGGRGYRSPQVANNDDNDYGNDDDTSAMVPKNLTLPVWCDLKNA